MLVRNRMRSHGLAGSFGASCSLRSPGRLRGAAFALVALLSVAVSTSGCLGRSPQVRRFMLGVEEVAAAERGAPDVSVLVGPVRLPAYLARPELARLGKNGEIELDARLRWLGSFEENCLRAVSLGVAKRLGSNRVVTHPSKAPFPIEYVVRLHVDDLIVEGGGVLRVRIRWALVGPDGRGTGSLAGPPARLFVFEERRTGVGGSPEARVHAHEAVLAELAARIAAAIVEAEAGAIGDAGPDAAPPAPADGQRRAASPVGCRTPILPARAGWRRRAPVGVVRAVDPRRASRWRTGGNSRRTSSRRCGRIPSATRCWLPS